MSARKRRTVGPSKPTGQAVLIASDFFVTGLLPILTAAIAQATFGDARTQLASLLRIEIPQDWMFIILIIMMLIVLAPLSQWMNGSIFNPCDVAAQYAVGKLPFRAAFQRSIAQVIGALTGAYAVTVLLPNSLGQSGKMLVAVVQPGIEVTGGATSEFLFTYLVTLLVLRTQRSTSILVRYWAPLIATAAALKLGAAYSGPILNPAAAFSWSFLYWSRQSLTPLQHVIVFWAAPIAGSILATYTDLGMQATVSSALAAAKKRSKVTKEE